MATVPATAAEIHYPDSDGQPVGETPFHIRNLFYITAPLERRFAGRPQTCVAANMFVYYVEGKPRKHVSPDVFVARDVAAKSEAERRRLADVDAGRVRRQDSPQRFRELLLALRDQRRLELRIEIEMVLDRALRAAGDEDQAAGPRRQRLLHRVLDQRLVDDRQHFLRARLGGGQEARAAAGDGENRKTDRCGTGHRPDDTGGGLPPAPTRGEFSPSRPRSAGWRGSARWSSCRCRPLSRGPRRS